tara:strand:- start:1014 stop:1295 length:282 start_codon:yes stop_codon:yes gene_type:complete
MAHDVTAVNVMTGEITKRNYTAEEVAENAKNAPTVEMKMARIRQRRDALLHETDWWSLADSPEMTDAQKNYRQALRDLPASVDADNPVYPEKP